MQAWNQKVNYDSGVVLFFNQLETRSKLCSQTYVSFFNEIETEKMNYAH